MAIAVEVECDEDFKVLVVVPQEVQRRLAKTSFRGTYLKRAGNFSKWSTVHDLFADSETISMLAWAFRYLHKRGDEGNFHFTIRHTDVVGWSLVAPRELYDETQIEPFEASEEDRIMIVRLNRTDLPAPQTDKTSLLLDFGTAGPATVATIHSIVPGEVIQTRGNSATHDEFVFFDRNHPGA